VKKSTIFILVNILISATVTLLVLLIWDLTHKNALIANDQEPDATVAMPVEECEGTIPSNGEGVLAIQNVIGKGDLQKEEVDILYNGTSQFCFNGWKLSDQDGNVYSFPKFFQIYTAGITVKVFSRPGSDTPLELFWGQSKPVWRSGESVHLIDPAGKVIATYLIP
jgi:hypothetical protein